MSASTWKKAFAFVVAFVVATCVLAGCSANRPSESSASSSGAESSGVSSDSSSVSDGASSPGASSSSDSSSALSSQSSSASSSSAASGLATAVAEAQNVGNDEVGYVQVPSEWEDHTDDMALGTVEAYKIVYYADPNTRYGSETLGHDSYAKAIQLIVASTPSADMAADIVADFKRNADSFSSVESKEILIGERPAILITALMPKDDLRVATIVFDRDGDGHSTVAITMNCGGDEASFEEALARASAWSLQPPATQSSAAAAQTTPAEQEGAQSAASQQ